MKEQPDEEILDIVNYRELQQSEQLKLLLSPYIQHTDQKVTRETTSDFIKMVVRYMEGPVLDVFVTEDQGFLCFDIEVSSPLHGAAWIWIRSGVSQWACSSSEFVP